jgi:hypothetical protein
MASALVRQNTIRELKSLAYVSIGFGVLILTLKIGVVMAWLPVFA